VVSQEIGLSSSRFSAAEHPDYANWIAWQEEGE
jgi:hypothetical protein